MSDEQKTKRQLIAELEELRQRVACLETAGLHGGDSSPQATSEECPCQGDADACRQLKEERDRLRTILTAAVECLPFHFWALDAEGRYILANAATRAMWGEIIGKRPADLAMDEKTLSLWLDNNRRVLEGKKVEEYSEFAVDGETRTFHNVIVPIRKGEQILGILGVNVDITERMRAEKALQESEQRFRYVLENSPDAAYRRNLQNEVFEYLGPAIQRLTGFTVDEMAGMSNAELLIRSHPDDWSRVVDETARAFEAKTESCTIEYRFRKKSGEFRWLANEFRMFADSEGKPLYQLGVLRDITERKQAEESLRGAHDELEQRVSQRTAELAVANEQLRREIEERRQAEEELALFKRFAEASGQGFGMSDLEGIVRYLNPTMARMMGEESPEAVLGTPVISHFPEDARKTIEEENFPTTMEGGNSIGEIPFLTKQGELIPAIHHTLLIRDHEGRPFRLAVVSTDISERKRAEAALRASEERFRSYFQQALIGMAVVSMDGHWMEVNERLSEILGYSREELVHMTWMDATHPDDIDASLTQYDRLVAGEMDHYTVDKRYIHRDGSIVYATLFVRCFRRKDGSPDHVLSLIEDISERKRAQEALERERRTLEHLFRSSDHERQLIAYDIHDGLAQFLAGAIMQFDTVAHLKDTDADEAVQAFEAGMRMLRRSHAEARRLISGVRPPILDEEGIVAAVSHLIHEHRQPHGPNIEFQAAVKFGRLVSIQENAIYRIIQEGLANACKYSQSEEVRVGLVQQGPGIRIEIEDWGVGFDPGRIGEHSFGLEGIRERTRLPGGQCTIESTPGKGTRITIELPLVLRESDS